MTNYALEQSYSIGDLPLMPPKRRLSAKAWEAAWWVALKTPILTSDIFDDFVRSLNCDSLNVRINLRTPSKVCVIIRTIDLPEAEVFEKSMKVLAVFEKQFGEISRIEGKPAENWPYKEVAGQAK